MGYNGPPPPTKWQVTCAVHGTECKKQPTKFGPRWSCPESECDQVTLHENQPTASQDVREAIKYLMDDLKAAIVLGSQPEYLDELYCSIGIPLSSDGVTIQGIREDFRKYDQRMCKEATLVEIVLQLKPLTTAAGFETHKSITCFLKALDDCKKIPGAPMAEGYYRMKFRDFTGISVVVDPAKSDLWTAFSGHNTWQGVFTVDQAMDKCQWLTSPTAWANGTPGEPQPVEKKASSKTQKYYEPSFEKMFEDVTGTLKQTTPCHQCGTPMETAQVVCNFCGSTQKQMTFIEAVKAAKPNMQGGKVSKYTKMQAAPKAQPDAAIVDIAPKRKFNLE